MPFGKVLCAVLLTVSAGIDAFSQTAQPSGKAAGAAVSAPDAAPEGGTPRYIRPETPEERRERLGTDEDPGPDPDPQRLWVRLGAQFRIVKFPKATVTPTKDPRFVQPHPSVNLVEEVYQENDKYVWVWVPVEMKQMTREERRNAYQYRDYSKEALAYLASLRSDFEPLMPPASGKRLRFEAASEGLPRVGSWRNSPAVADMNGDGFADLVLPSQRGASSGEPLIFLGDGKGKWALWDVKWPNRINYGTAVAADFNKDGNMDVAFGVHLSGVVVLLGDGKGGFTEVERITDFPTRRIVTADLDQDGWLDIVANYEGPLVRARELKPESSANLRAYLNRKEGTEWEGMNISKVKEPISGDWLEVANFNGDAHPDFVGSSIYFNGTYVVYMSGAENEWKVFDPEGKYIPGLSTYFAVTAGKFSHDELDDAILSSVRRWPDGVNPESVAPPPLPVAISIDRISFHGSEPKRTPIVRFAPDEPIRGLSHGDFDGDSHQDIIYTRGSPRQAVILLGDGKGNFEHAMIEGLTVAPETNYDITIADVNGDARPDVVLMYEAASGGRRSGKVEVFLNGGVIGGE